MADNSIDLVRKTESEAEEAARAAAKEAQKIVDDAQAQAVQLKQNAEDDAHSKAAEKVAAANKASQDALNAAMTSLDAEMDELAQKARANQPRAVEQILANLA